MALDDVLAVVLGGGAGKRLFPLTLKRAKPAVPVGGKYRLVDIPVSNCINSEILRIFILTQYNSASLNRHIGLTFRFSRFQQGFTEVLAAEMTPERSDWFQGTADAVRQCYEHIDDYRPEEILVLSGDHLYRMDYRKLVTHHRRSGADVTLCVTPVRPEAASSYGLVHVDERGRVIAFREKPTGAALEEMRVNTTRFALDAEESRARPFLASMGIYLFRSTALRSLLFDRLPDAMDFGRELLPAALGVVDVGTWVFPDYWEDIGTIGTFYRANMELTLERPPFSFFDAKAPIYTRPRFLPGSQLSDCEVRRSILTEGCQIDGASLTNSIIGIRSIIRRGAKLHGVLMMGADAFESQEQLAEARDRGLPPVGIAEATTIRRAIVDKNARIGKGVKILNESGDQTRDGDGYSIRDGIVVIPKGAVLHDGTVI